MNNKEKYLPIGTVVLLNGGKTRLMITGYAVINKEEKKMYDYCGCVFPYGIINSEQNLLFNHSDIKEIYAIGYQDEEQIKFADKLKTELTGDNIKKLLDTVDNKKGE